MNLTCPACRCGLQVPAGTTAMVRCPACKTTFSPDQAPEPYVAEAEPDPEPQRPEGPLHLICPVCRSGLQVPAGTTAMVRCPACKAVFAPQDFVPDDSESEEEAVRERPTGADRRRSRNEDEDDHKPQRKPALPDDDDNEERRTEGRDFDPEPDERKRKRRRSYHDESLSPAERDAQKRAFGRAAWGAKLIWISFSLFMSSMLLIVLYHLVSAINREPRPAFLILAGVLGLMNWTLGLIGVGLCLSGPSSPGHWGYGIASMVVTAFHFLMVLALVGMARDNSLGAAWDSGASEVARWLQLPTHLDIVAFYLFFAAFADLMLMPIRWGMLWLSFAVGVLELLRIVLIMVQLSCLARAAGDEDLSRSCTRGGGIACFGPGILAVVMLLLGFASKITNFQPTFSLQFTLYYLMGIYAVLAGIMLPAFTASREVYEACEEPFQSQLNKHL
jgi:LSD1 subclass zinc finger protein